MAYDVARVRGLHPSLGDGWVHFDAQHGMLVPDSVATTVSTAFRDESTVTGKYFNEIVKELQTAGKGTAQAQILQWMKALHGHLSSPTGGGVRHGIDLKAGVAIEPHEARLYCNLIRSYITFLIEEHERRTSPKRHSH